MDFRFGPQGVSHFVWAAAQVWQGHGGGVDAIAFEIHDNGGGWPNRLWRRPAPRPQTSCLPVPLMMMPFVCPIVALAVALARALTLGMGTCLDFHY